MVHRSKKAKALGLKSFVEAAEISTFAESTLDKMSRKYPQKLYTILLGAAYQKLGGVELDKLLAIKKIKDN